MPDPGPHARTTNRPRLGMRGMLRVVALAAWAGLLLAFWLGARGAGLGPVEYLLVTLDAASNHRWAPAGLLGLYLLRPLLLVPITVANLATGFFLGVVPGIALALVGTLLSASVGYALGRFMGTAGLAEDLSVRWPLVRFLRRRSFESVVAGGLMYLHADMVNLPAGLLRIRFPTFLLGITLGNALTMTTAVLTGASVTGSLADASITLRVEYLGVAGVLFLVSLTLAYWLRRRTRTVR